MATLLRIGRRWNLANPRIYSNISILRYSSTAAATTTTTAASSTTAKPSHPKAARAQVAKLRRGYAMQLKELRKLYMYDMKLQKQEKMRKDEARREEILRQRKNRNKLKAAYAAARAVKRTVFEDELRQTLEIMADKKLVGSEGCSKSQDVAPTRAPTRVTYNFSDKAMKPIVLSDVPPLYPVFVVFSVCVHLDPEIQGELSGYIRLTDELGSVVLFHNVYDESIPIRNNELVPLQVPADSCDRAVSAFRQVDFDLGFFIKVEDKDEVVNLDMDRSNDFERSLERVRYNQYRSFDTDGEDGYNCTITVYYAALERGVQATVEASFQNLDDDNGPLQVYGTIVAYYGKCAMKCKPRDKKYYQITLFRRQKGNCKSALQGTGKIPLSRSVVALPSECSLVIEAHLHNDTGDEILGGTYSFPAKLKDSSDGSIEGKGFNLTLKVAWLCREQDEVRL